MTKVVSKRSRERIFFQLLLLFFRPFAKPIRYLMLKIMKKLRHPYDDRPQQATAEHIVSEFILPSGFRLFHNATFRERALFHKLPRVEHDRIFNEIMVAGICSALFYLRAAKTLVRLEDHHFWQGVEHQIPAQFQKTLMGFGAESGNATMYQGLIDMRREEYQKISEDILKFNRSENKGFLGLSEEMQYVAAAMKATAIGTADHILRGKLKKDDPLPGFLTDWLMGLRRTLFRFVKKL